MQMYVYIHMCVHAFVYTSISQFNQIDKCIQVPPCGYLLPSYQDALY